MQTTGVRTPAGSWLDPTLVVRGSQWRRALPFEENYSLSIWRTEQASLQARCQDVVAADALAQCRGRAAGLQRPGCTGEVISTW